MADEAKGRQRRHPPSARTKFQLCRYKAKEGGAWRFGIAWLNFDFGTSDVGTIIDCDTATVADDVWDYELIERPLSYIDLAYRG